MDSGNEVVKHWIFVVILFMASCVNADEDAGVDSVIIHYYGFEIERITGIHEEEIQKLGCLYTSSEKKIVAALLPLETGKPGYDAFDIRARIQIGSATYFVDRDGVVRQGDSYFRLDKDSFVKALTLVDDCK